MQDSVQENKVTNDFLSDFLTIVKNNYILILLILVTVNVTVFIYLKTTTKYYDAKTILKFSKPQGSVLSSNLIPGLEEITNDKYAASEIEVMKTFPIRLKAAEIILDSIARFNNNKLLYYILRYPDNPEKGVKNASEIANLLPNFVEISQKKGLVIIDITATSPSPYEAYIVSNSIGLAYSDLIISQSKQDITNSLVYVANEKEKKYNDLNTAEAAVEEFQKRTGLIIFEAQAKNLIDNLSELDKELGVANVEFLTSSVKNKELTDELNKINPQLISYLNGELNNPYIVELQKKIADLEVQKKVELQSTNDPQLKEKISREYDVKIKPLTSEYDTRYEVVKNALFSQTPAERRALVQELIISEVQTRSDKAKIENLNKFIKKYEAEINKLPENSIELIKLERQRSSSEKLYLILEEKYQELMINKNARIGSVNIIEPALIPLISTKPNRKQMIILGVILSIIFAFGIAYAINYFDKTIKNPEQLERKGLTLLSWIPTFDTELIRQTKTDDILSTLVNSSSVTEAFKVLRTRILYSKLEETPLKTILVTSSVPSEGKSTVAISLASGFAFSNKKTLLIDCDLRKPKIHSLMNTNKSPGLTDYLFGVADKSEIIKKSTFENLDYITCGTIPPNPSELLASNQMLKFIKMVSEEYDFIIVDSPPTLSVTDSEILFRLTDGTIIIAQAHKTPIDVFLKVYERFRKVSNHKLLGVVLNNFNMKNYTYYYYYYSYYGRNDLKRKV